MEISEQYLMKLCLNNTDSLEDGVNLYKAFEYIDYFVYQTIYVSNVCDSDGKVNLELIEFIARSLGKSNLDFNFVLINSISESQKNFVIWAFTFFYYQEAKGNLIDDSVIDIFTSEYIPYKFNLNEIGVKNIIVVAA